MTAPSMLERTANALRTIVALLIALLIVIGIAFAYGFLRMVELTERVATLEGQLATKTDALSHTLNAATSSLRAVEQEVRGVRTQIGGVEDRVGSISGTVHDLKTLSSIDAELLAKYSKVFFLNENYAPARLEEIPKEFRYAESRPAQVIPEVLPYLERMLTDAGEENIPLYVFSAYRSYNIQVALKDTYRRTYGEGTANSFSADQGYSEHQLGTTVDLITKGLGGTVDGFERKPAFAWMKDHAHEYGFTLSFPHNNGFYIFEPWHWRFVGVKLATYLHDNKKYFNDIDQRTLDSYLVSLFDAASSTKL